MIKALTQNSSIARSASQKSNINKILTVSPVDFLRVPLFLLLRRLSSPEELTHAFEDRGSHFKAGHAVEGEEWVISKSVLRFVRFVGVGVRQELMR